MNESILFSVAQGDNSINVSNVVGEANEIVEHRNKNDSSNNRFSLNTEYEENRLETNSDYSNSNNFNI